MHSKKQKAPIDQVESGIITNFTGEQWCLKVVAE
jgi:hypothetical protein